MTEKLRLLFWMIILGEAKTSPFPDFAQESGRYLVAHSFVARKLAGRVENLLVENGTGPVSQIRNLAEKLKIKTVLDLTHAGAGGQDIILAHQILNSAVIHFSDYSKEKGQHLVPGEGELPLEEFLKKIKEDGWEGYITIELSFDLTYRKAKERVKETLDFIKKYLF